MEAIQAIVGPFILSLATKYPIALTIFAILGSLPILGAVYVKLTPNQEDDKWLAKVEASPVIGWLLKMFIQFSPLERKEK